MPRSSNGLCAARFPAQVPSKLVEDFDARNAAGETVRVRAAKLVAILKGDPDPVLRQSARRGHAGVITPATANSTPAFSTNCTASGSRASSVRASNPLSVSLAQNRMSRECLKAIRTAILRNTDWIREGFRMRARVLGTPKMAYWDVLAPAPGGLGRRPAPHAL